MPVLNTKHKHKRKPSRNSLNSVNCFTQSQAHIDGEVIFKDVLYDFVDYFKKECIVAHKTFNIVT